MTKLSNKMAEAVARSAVEQLIEPQLKWKLGTLNLVRSVHVEEDTIHVHIGLISPDQEAHDVLRQQASEVLAPLGRRYLHFKITRLNVGTQGVSGVRNILLVGSGKGGVGKSCVASNVAVAMAQEGLQIGLLDADVYGPSLPTMMGVKDRPEVLPEEHLKPLTAHGVKIMSVGSLVDATRPLDWRGQMVGGTLVQFADKTAWGKLDVLLLDLPPGSGDAQLTIAHKLRVNGVLLVTTPQEVALGDVRRNLAFYEQRSVPVLGLVVNMSGLVCEKCQHHNQPFGASSAPSDDNDPLSRLPVLAQLPLSRQISESGDTGTPIALRGRSDPLAAPFFDVADALTRVLDLPDHSPTQGAKQKETSAA